MRSLLGQTSRLAIWAVMAAGITIPSLALAQAEDAGFGKDIPLGMAVKRLVPAGTEVKMGPGVDAKAKVSWNGGGWKDALGTATRGLGYAVSVKGDKVEVTKAGVAMVTSESAGEADAGAMGTERPLSAPRRMERVERSERIERREASSGRGAWRRPRHAEAEVRHERVERRVRRVEVATAETVSGGGFVMLPVRREAPPAVEKAAWSEPGPGPAAERGPRGPAGGTLIVQEGDNLQAVLSDWCTRNGWRLRWNNEFSYRLASSARFSGGFVEATSELLKSMRDVRPLVTASFFQGNKTLVVGNDSSDGAGQ
jgi:hypothetical protein